MQTASFDDLAESFATGCPAVLSKLLPPAIQHEVGHFNVFNLANIAPAAGGNVAEPYSCRTFYKISFLTGTSDFSFPGRTVKIRQPTLLFTTPKLDTYWLPYGRQTGHFCVFTPEFLHPTKSGVILDELPIYKSPEPAFMLADADATRIQGIFEQMESEITSGYAYKYDLLRAYALELIHLGQKLQPADLQQANHSAFARTTTQFIELLERQFPLQNRHQRVALRTAKEYADHLAAHVNHLNKVLKETTGLTTTELIAGRLLQEAKALLLQTDWTIAEIADCLGFSDFAHFAKFFKSHTGIPPAAFRVQVKSLNHT